MALVTGGIHKIECSVANTQIKHMFDGSGGSLLINSANYKIMGGAEDVTDTNSAGVSRYISKLKTGEIAFTCRYPKSSPRLGNSANLSISGVTFTQVTKWNINVQFPAPVAVDYGTGSAVNWKNFVMNPGYSWSGSATCKWLSSAAFEIPEDANTGGAAGTFKLTENGTDPAMTGNVFISNGPDLTLDKATTADLKYDFQGDGALTFVAGTTLPAILPAGALAGSDWDVDGDGTADVTTVCTLYTGRTITGPMALTALNISYDGGDAPLVVTGTLKFMSVPSFA